MKRLVCAAVCVLALAGCARKGDVVATVDGVAITAEAFRARYEQFLAQGGKRDNIVLRQEILNNMINERLMYTDIARQGMDRDSAYRRRMRMAEAQALLDGYARRISFDTIKITEEDARQEFRFFNTKASARYLYAKTEAGARELKRRLEQGETFESLAREVFEDPGLATNGGYLGVFGWGEMESALEEAAFTLPLGTISDPIKLRVGYAIVKPESRVVQPLASESDYYKVRQKLADRVQEKKIDRLVRKAGEEVAQALAPSFHEHAVQEVFKNWNVLVREQPGGIESRELPENISAMKFMEFSRGSWTVGDFIAKAEWTTDKQRRRVQSPDDVKDIAIGLATRDVLLERARAMNLQNDSTVKAQIAHVRERYLLKRWADSVMDTVGRSGWDERLLDSVYNAHRAQFAFPPEVNVAEILVRTEEEAKALRKQLDRGGNFAELARKHSIRLWAAKRGGELGFGTKATFGPMGEKFFAARVGELIGPVFVDPYWAVFKIIERKPGREKSFEEAREDVIAGLLPARKQRAFREALGALRARASVSINTDALANVVITSEPKDQARR
jgi:foldase protein PrsA